MKRIFIFIVLVVLSFSGFSQIDKEINSFVDTTENFFSNGRAYLEQSIREKNYDKAIEIYDYLKDFSSYRKAFHFSDEVGLAIALQRWEDLKLLLAETNEAKNRPVYNFEDMLYYTVFDNINQRTTELKISVDKYQATPDFHVILKLLINNFDSNFSTKAEYRELYNQFKEGYPTSVYYEFFELYIQEPHVRVSTSWDIGSGYVAPLGDLSNHFKPNAIFSLSWDVCVHKVYASIYFNVTGLELKKGFTTNLNGELTEFKPTDYFSFANVGGKCGYFLVRNDRFQFAPFLGLSGLFVESNLYSEDSGMDEFDFISTVGMSAGIHSALTFYRFDYNYSGTSTPISYYHNNERSSFALKCDIGYTHSASVKMPHAAGGFLTAQLGFLWRIGN